MPGTLDPYGAQTANKLPRCGLACTNAFIYSLIQRLQYHYIQLFQYGSVGADKVT
jgi:hypothetical protein